MKFLLEFKMTLIRRTAALSIILITICFNGFGQVDFSGKWKLNLEKTVFAEQMPVSTASAELEIIQSKDSITLIRKRNNTAWSETLSFNGTESIKEQPGSKRTAALQWSTDKKSFVENVKVEREAQEKVSNSGTVHTWTLSEDGKVMTVTSVYQFANREPLTLKAVYDKQ
jgi:hypothetical protein